MEKAILETLKYGDIFDFPMKVWEVHKWLIKKRAGFKQVEKGLKGLSKKGKVKNQNGYYFLEGRKGLIKKREERKEVSKKHFDQVRWVGRVLKIIPFIKMIGVSGSLAMGNSRASDDIDILVVTQRGRLFLARLLLIFILDFLGVRRKRDEKGERISGKICINILLNEDSLAQSSKDIYLAHEILQLEVLWERDNIYSKFLEENSWALKYLPNWTSSTVSNRFRIYDSRFKNKKFERKDRGFVDYLEGFSKWLQIRYMGKPQGKERVTNGALYFHPNDLREDILKKFASN